MSLINDALKRANQAQKKNQPATPPTGSLQPVQTPAYPQKSWTPVIVGAVLALIGLSFFFWKGGNKTEVKQNDSEPPFLVANNSKAAPADPNPIVPGPDVKPVARPVNEQPPGEPPPAVRTALQNPVQRLTKTVPNSAAPALVAEPAATPAVPVTPPPVASATTSIPATPIAAAPGSAAPELKLQGIFYRLKNPSAMINGQTIGVGETVDGARVVSIERTAVVLSRDGRQETLRLK